MGKYNIKRRIHNVKLTKITKCGIIKKHLTGTLNKDKSLVQEGI